MYKTIIAEYATGFLMTKGIGYELQNGKVESLNKLLNEEYEKGWELVSMTSSPWRIDDQRCNYLLVFKKRGN